MGLNFCNRKNLDTLQESKTIKIPNNGRTKLRNVHKIKEDTFENGIYEVFSADNSFKGSVTIKDNHIIDIRELLKAFDEPEIKLSLQPNSSTLVATNTEFKYS